MSSFEDCARYVGISGGNQGDELHRNLMGGTQKLNWSPTEHRVIVEVLRFSNYSEKTLLRFQR